MNPDRLWRRRPMATEKTGDAVAADVDLSPEKLRFLCNLLLDQNQPISERFRALFSLRNLKGEGPRSALIIGDFLSLFLLFFHCLLVFDWLVGDGNIRARENFCRFYDSEWGCFDFSYVWLMQLVVLLGYRFFHLIKCGSVWILNVI